MLSRVGALHSLPVVSFCIGRSSALSYGVEAWISHILTLLRFER
jgi:hypothetical protein